MNFNDNLIGKLLVKIIASTLVHNNLIKNVLILFYISICMHCILFRITAYFTLTLLEQITSIEILAVNLAAQSLSPFAIRHVKIYSHVDKHSLNFSVLFRYFIAYLSTFQSSLVKELIFLHHQRDNIANTYCYTEHNSFLQNLIFKLLT